MKPDIFRKVSLERLSSPEQLDQLIKITTPKAWYSLIAIMSLIVTTIVWGFFGRISVKVMGQGIMIQGGGIQQIVHTQPGVITDISVSPGDIIKPGDVIARLDCYDTSVSINEMQGNLDKLRETTVDKMYDPEEFSIELTELYEIAYSIKNAKSSLDIQSAGFDQSKDNSQYQLERARLGVEQAQTSYEQAKVSEEQSEIQVEQAQFAFEQSRLHLEEALSTLKQQEQELEKTVHLYEAGIISKSEVEEMERTIEATKVQVKMREIDQSNAQKSIVSAKSNISTAKMNKKTAQTAIETARTELSNSEKVLTGITGNRTEKTVEGSQLNQAQTGLASAQERFEAIKKSKIEELEEKIEKSKIQIAFDSTVVSPVDGRILEVQVKKGDIIQANMPIVSATNSNEFKKDIQTILYVPIEQGKQIIPGMEVQVSPSVVKQEEHGFILGRVVSVSEYSASSSNMMLTLGNQDLVQRLTGSGAPIEVKVDLVYDDTTESGFKWSTKKGPPIKIGGGTICTGSIAVEKKRPIELVMPFIRKILSI